jgi:hypothetical protein
VIDTRIPEMISLLHSGRIDDATKLMEEFNGEGDRVRPVWCPSDVRRTAAVAAQHTTERGVAV